MCAWTRVIVGVVYLVLTPAGSVTYPLEPVPSVLLPPLILCRLTEAMFSSRGVSKDRIIRRWELSVWKYSKYFEL